MKKAISIAIIFALTMHLPITSAIGKPDLEIRNQDIEFSDDTPETGQEVIINATVRNIGTEKAENIKVRFNDTYRIGTERVTETIWEDTISIINATENKIATAKWTPQTAGEHTITVIADPYNEIEETNENNNDGQQRVFVFPSTDLEVTVELSVGEGGKSGRYYPKEEFWVNGTVKTSVGTNVANADVRITIDETNATWNTTTDSNGNYFQNITSPEKPKRYKLIVNATRGTQSGENDSATFRVLSSPEATLSIINILINPSTPKDGDKVKITVNIENSGTGDAEDVSIAFILDRKLIENITIDKISKDTSEDVYIEWTAEKGKWTIRVEVWYNDELADNKERTITIEEAISLQTPVDFTMVAIIGIVVLIGVIVFAIIKKRKNK